MTMAEHLKDEEFLEDPETLPAAARGHLEACPSCRQRRADVEDGLALAAEGGAVPEPAPMYWEAFRRQVERRIADEPAPSAWASWRRWLSLRALVPVGAAAVVAVMVAPSWRPPQAPEAAARVLPAWEALPPAADDDGLDVLLGLALSGDDLDGAAGCREVAECLSTLSDEETQDLAELLRQRLPEARS